MRCRLCNSEIDEDSKFCKFCGNEQPDYHLPTFKAFLHKIMNDNVRIYVAIFGSIMYTPLFIFIVSIFTKDPLLVIGITLAIDLLIFVITMSKTFDDQF